MEGYIVTDGGYILTRAILLLFVLIHCFVGYGNSALRFYVPPKLYHGFFITEFIALTAFIIWCCINEPFKDGVAWAVFGYFFVYLMLLSCWAISRHLMISHTEIYRMTPQYRIDFEGKKGIEGVIKAGGVDQTVAVFSDELHDNVQKDDVFNVRFVSYPDKKLFSHVEAVMEEVKDV